MTLTNQQIATLKRAMDKLESADYSVQNALGDRSEDLHYRIEDILADIEQLIEEAEMVDN